jgi:hypothetical protein
LRTILGLLIGAFVAAFIIALAIWLTPGRMTPGPDLYDPLAELTVAIKVVLCVGLFVAAFSGALLADLVAGKGVVGWIVAGLVVVAVLLFGVRVPHPTWMALLGVVLPLIGGYAARKITHAPL